MTTKSITSGQQKSIVRLVEEAGETALAELGLSKNDAQMLLGKGGEFKSRLHKLLSPLVRELSLAPNIVVVPDLAAVDLTALVKRELRLTYLDGDYERWDYYRGVDGSTIDGRGQKFEALVWKPEIGSNNVISSEKVRAYFRERGFSGNTAAFTQWRRTCGLDGYHASIPEDAACWRDSGGLLYAPYSVFDGDHRRLLQYWLGDGWRDDWSFVGFRAVS